VDVHSTILSREKTMRSTQIVDEECEGWRNGLRWTERRGSEEICTDEVQQPAGTATLRNILKSSWYESY
jgi:hypothetical protein